MNNNENPMSVEVPDVKVEAGVGTMYPPAGTNNPPCLAEAGGGDGTLDPLDGSAIPPATKKKRKARGAGTLHPPVGPWIPPSCLRFAADPATAKDVPFVWLDDDGNFVVRVFESLEAGIAELPGGAMLIIENTANGYDPRDKPKIVAAAAAAGILLRTIPSRMTRGMSAELGFDEKSDYNDAKIIYKIGFSGRTHLARFRPDPVGDEWVELRETLLEILVRSRRMGWGDEMSAKAAPIIAAAGCKKSSRTIQFAIAAMFAASRGLTAKEYDRLLGLNSFGYPNMIRAVTLYHGLGKLKSAKGKDGKPPRPYQREEARKKMKGFRSESRRIFHFAKEI